MRNLFPEKIRKFIEFKYHLISKIDKEKFKPEKPKKDYLSKISYKRIFINNKNEEEILFGYKLEPQLKQLLEVKDIKRAEEDLNKSKNKTISIEFGKDLEILIKDEKFKNILEEYFSKFTFKDDKELNPKFRSIKYTMIKVPNPKDKQFKKDLDSLLNRAKEIKKNNLLDEEIGVTYFYNEVFKKEKINIYGTNLKQKLYFAIKHLLLEPNKNNEEEIQKMLNKVNIYDISYICLSKNIDFFKKYLRLKKDEELKERTMTQRLGYVIEEIEELKNREDLDEFKNKFYFDEKDKITKKHYICIEKNKFYEKSENIVNVFQNITDFTVNKNAHDNNLFELNIIDPRKYGEIENIAKAVEAC